MNNNINYIFGLEYLCEKTLLTIYSLLCTNHEQLPMSTYIVTRDLFQGESIAYIICYTMKCYPDNITIQKYGLDIIYNFVKHRIELNDFMLYTPTVLVIALNINEDNTVVHEVYANIILLLVQSSLITTGTYNNNNNPSITDNNASNINNASTNIDTQNSNNNSNNNDKSITQNINDKINNNSINSFSSNVNNSDRSIKEIKINITNTNIDNTIDIKASLIKYGTHNGLCAILRKHNNDVSYTCLLALQALSNQAIDAMTMITHNESIIHGILYCIDAHPYDLRIHVEGIKTLLKFETSIEYKRMLEQSSNQIIFKKARKVLISFTKDMSKYPNYIEYYTKQDVLAVIHMTNKSHCIIA